MNYKFDISLKNRNILNTFFEKCSFEELNKIAEGFNNNVIWNIAHVVVTQQILVYDMSGLPMLVREELVEKYRKGTKADRDVTQNEVDEIKSLMFSTIEQTKLDYKNGVFKEYNAYTTSTNSSIKNVDEAMAFNNFHEGIHLGYILALKRLL